MNSINIYYVNYYAQDTDKKEMGPILREDRLVNRPDQYFVDKVTQRARQQERISYWKGIGSWNFFQLWEYLCAY